MEDDGKDMDRNGTISNLPGWTKENREINKYSLCPGPNSNLTLPRYEPTALPLHQSFS
jgi:hypothetical protein